jgi:polyhydroxyalkanoate synthesis regulator phasin
MADSLELVQRKIEFRQEVLKITEEVDDPLTLKDMARESDWIDISLPADMNTLRGIVVVLEKDGYLEKSPLQGRPAWVRTTKKYDPIDDDIALTEATEYRTKAAPKKSLDDIMRSAKKANDTAKHSISDKLTQELKKLKQAVEDLPSGTVKSTCMDILNDELTRTINYIREMEIDIKMLNAEKDNFINILTNVTSLINDVV